MEETLNIITRTNLYIAFPQNALCQKLKKNKKLPWAAVTKRVGV